MKNVFLAVVLMMITSKSFADRDMREICWEENSPPPAACGWPCERLTNVPDAIVNFIWAWSPNLQRSAGLNREQLFKPLLQVISSPTAAPDIVGDAIWYADRFWGIDDDKLLDAIEIALKNHKALLKSSYDWEGKFVPDTLGDIGTDRALKDLVDLLKFADQESSTTIAFNLVYHFDPKKASQALDQIADQIPLEIHYFLVHNFYGPMKMCDAVPKNFRLKPL